MNLLNRRTIFRKRHCPHVHLQGLYGDVINATGGYRLQCTDCWTYLEGPVSLSWVDRDPEKAVPSQDDWFLMKDVGV